MEEACATALEEAIKSVMLKCRASSKDEVLMKLKEGDGCIHSHFRYSLMVNLTKCISTKLKGMKGIYIFGSSLDPDIADFSSVSDINIILHTTRTYPTNNKQMEALNDVLTTTYRDLLSLDCKDCFRLLDYHFVQDKEYKKGTGIAVKLRSIEDPALRIWGGR